MAFATPSAYKEIDDITSKGKILNATDYLLYHEDVRQHNIDPIEHYLMSGIFELRMRKWVSYEESEACISSDYDIQGAEITKERGKANMKMPIQCVEPEVCSQTFRDRKSTRLNSSH